MQLLKSRRSFLKSAVFTAGAAALSQARVIGANESIRLAVIGAGNKGGHLIDVFGAVENVTIVAVCDPDGKRMREAAERIAKAGRPKPDQEKDFRKLLERDDIDVVVIASPNHWHALQTILACQAGKDVYVEKPAAHTIREGRMMVEAAEKHGRIVQVGLQTSSNTGMDEAIEWLGEGHLGKLKAVHAFWFKPRVGIGKRKSPLRPPSSVDYDLWLGPASDIPMYRDELHYDWHWDWNTGNGEMGNTACHAADVARRFLGESGPPRGVTTFGNRFQWDDAGVTPNVHAAAFDYDVPLTVEINSLAIEPGKSRTMAFHKLGTGIVAVYEGGEFRGLGSGKAYNSEGKSIKSFKASNPVLDHAMNFLSAVRSRKAEDLNCSIGSAHASCSISLLGGVAWRSGKPVSPAYLKQRSDDHPTLGEVFHRYSAQLENWNTDFGKTPWVASPELGYDPVREVFTGPHAAAADRFLQRESYRKPFQLPATV